MSTQAELASEDASIDIAHPIPKPNQLHLALQDIKEGCQQWRIWLMLAYQDIQLRYRRSILGPFWITLSMAITVYSMGFLYAHLFHVELSHYFPFVTSSMLAWSFISTVIIEMTDGFSASESIIKQIKLPYSLYIHRIVTRNLIIFFHNIIVMIPIYLIFHASVKINFHTLLLIPGLMLTYIDAMIYGLILAIICARFRDMGQIIKSLVQVIFFLTPVMWSIDILSPSKQIFIKLNPFYSLLELIRAPLLGTSPTLFNFVCVLFISLIGLLICLKLFLPYRSRIIYWL